MGWTEYLPSVQEALTLIPIATQNPIHTYIPAFMHAYYDLIYQENLNTFQRSTLCSLPKSLG